MKVEIKVPAMGESITEATIGDILKPNGSKVAMDDEILELETDKVNQVLFAPEGGVINLSVATDDIVKIGQVIGHVDCEAQKQAKDKAKPSEEEIKGKTNLPQESKKEAPTAHQARIGKKEFIEEVLSPKEQQPSPLPSQQREQFEKKPPAQERRETRRRMTKIRRVIGERMIEAIQTTAMLTTFNEVDLSNIIELRAKYKDQFAKEFGAKLGFMSFFVKASISALGACPDINSYIDGEEIVHREYYDIGVAVGTERGLIVPVVRDCDQLSFAEIENTVQKYAQQAREGTINVDDLQGGGFTITNGGIYGSLLSTPILNPPQSAILGMHKIEKRAVVVDDEIVIRPMMYLALSYDHRLIDGKEAVTFLFHIKSCLEDPARLLLGV